MTSWTSLPTEEAFITLRALGRVALTETSLGYTASCSIVVMDEVAEMREVKEDVRGLKEDMWALKEQLEEERAVCGQLACQMGEFNLDMVDVRATLPLQLLVRLRMIFTSGNHTRVYSSLWEQQTPVGCPRPCRTS